MLDFMLVSIKNKNHMEVAGMQTRISITIELGADSADSER